MTIDTVSTIRQNLCNCAHRGFTSYQKFPRLPYIWPYMALRERCQAFQPLGRGNDQAPTQYYRQITSEPHDLMELEHALVLSTMRSCCEPHEQVCPATCSCQYQQLAHACNRHLEFLAVSRSCAVMCLFEMSCLHTRVVSGQSAACSFTCAPAVYPGV